MYFVFFDLRVKLKKRSNMKLVDIYQDAIKRKYSIGAFNFCNLESMKGILNSAEALNTHVIIAVSESALKYFGEEYLKNAIISARKTYTTPFFVHLDHGKDFEICKKAISLGFDSVMIDGSSLPIEENIKLTKSVVNYAHSKGVQVEGELGKLRGMEDDVVSDETLFTDPDEAERFVKETGVDSLAIAIGTSHGINKFSSKAEIRLDILKKIQRKLKNVPLVLHGASSISEDTILKINNLGGNLKNAKGVPEDILTTVSTKYNICKINVDSDIRMATTLAVREYLSNYPNEIDPRKYLGYAQTKITALVTHKIQNVFVTKQHK